MQAIAGATGDAQAMSTIMTELSYVKTWYFNDAIAGATADSTVYSNGYKKTYTDSHITDATKADVEFPNGDYVGKIKWETLATGDLNLWFSQDPNGCVARVTMIGLFQSGE